MKNHNKFYNDIPINYNWYSTVPDNEIPQLLLSEENVHESHDNTKNNHKHVMCSICDNQSVNDVTQDKLNEYRTNVEDDSNMERNESELVEDQITLQQRENLMGDVLPSVLQYEDVENAIFQCAPGQNNIPKYVLLDDDFEVLAFPDLFPFGQFSYYSQH